MTKLEFVTNYLDKNYYLDVSSSPKFGMVYVDKFTKSEMDEFSFLVHLNNMLGTDCTIEYADWIKNNKKIFLNNLFSSLSKHYIQNTIHGWTLFTPDGRKADIQKIVKKLKGYHDKEAFEHVLNEWFYQKMVEETRKEMNIED